MVPARRHLLGEPFMSSCCCLSILWPCRAMLPHISANEELQMPGLWRKEPWAELSYETVDAYRVGSPCLVQTCCRPVQPT